MKRISSVDISWQFFERMRDDGVFKRGVSVAVVPDVEVGWRAVIEGRGRKMSASARKRFNEIEEQLRAAFSLKDR
jgi:hypothetical protein